MKYCINCEVWGIMGSCNTVSNESEGDGCCLLRWIVI